MHLHLGFFKFFEKNLRTDPGIHDCIFTLFSIAFLKNIPIVGNNDSNSRIKFSYWIDNLKHTIVSSKSFYDDGYSFIHNSFFLGLVSSLKDICEFSKILTVPHLWKFTEFILTARRSRDWRLILISNETAGNPFSQIVAFMVQELCDVIIT